jgi:DUF1680 family protein
LLNQLFFNQLDNGAFCYLRGLQNRAGAAFDACCSHHGPRAFYDALRYIYTADTSSLWVNLYMPGTAQFPIGNQRIDIQTKQKNDADKISLMQINQADHC